MQHALRTPFLALLLLASTAAAQSRVEATVLGPTNEGGAFIVAARGAHVAYAGMKGTRFVVTVDGAPGPLFDELLTPSGQSYYFPQQAGAWASSTGGPGPVVFSDDGEHWAYAGRQGAEYVVIKDGAELRRGPRAELQLQSAPLTLSPRGRHAHWGEAQTVQGRSQQRLVLDGVPGPWCGSMPASPIFSADDTRSVYSVPQTDVSRATLIVDGRDAGYAGNEPRFTADGKVLLSTMYDSTGKAHVLVDGQPGPSGIGIDRVVTAPVGGRWGALVRTRLENYMGVATLFLDGREVPGTDGVTSVSFSPDGKRWAAACTNAASRSMFMMIDGVTQSEYQSVNDLRWWTPDSSRFLYLVGAGGRSFLVVDGEESPIRDMIGGNNKIAFGGSRYGYMTRDGSNRNFTMMIDGRNVLPDGLYPVDHSLTFSPDGARYAYFAGPVGRNEINTIVVDGAQVPGFVPVYFGRWVNGPEPPPAFVFSPDGKHLVHLARGAEPSSAGLYLDGRLVYPTTRQVWIAAFTPDGKHLVWCADEPPAVQGQPSQAVLYVDGRAAVRATSYFGQLWPWSMDADGTVTFLGAESGTARRWRVVPDPATSVATLYESGTTSGDAPAAALAAPAAAPPSAPAAPVVAPVTPAVAAAPAGAGEDLAWTTLVRRPELWPTSCTVKRELRFQDGGSVRAGSQAGVVELASNAVTLASDGGRLVFQMAPDETDVLDVARAAWARLTPAQRDLTLATVMQRTDLWPYRVRANIGFEVGGRTIRPGDPLLLLDGQGGEITVRIEGTDIGVNLQPQETDLVAQARGFLATDGAPGRLLEELAGKLVNPIDGRPIALPASARPRLVVLYMGAGWCGPCQQFSPGLVELLKDRGSRPEDVLAVYLSGDRSPAECKKYVEHLGVEWPTVRYQNSGQLPAFSRHFGQYIPQVVVTDRHGRVLVDSATVGTERALAELGKLL